MNLNCLCNWGNHEHQPGQCTVEAQMYNWGDGRNWQLCYYCVDKIEAWWILRDAPVNAKYYMGDTEPILPEL